MCILCGGQILCEMCYSILIFLCLVCSSFERSSPADDHYVAAVAEYAVNVNVDANRANYEALIQQAAQQNADIVVFPELTLTNATTSFIVPIHGLLQQYPIPALRPDLYDDLLVAMSAAARQNKIYLVVNGRERVDCKQPQDGEECPEQKLYIFNTNVVFDRNGAVIDRYRKINLFAEATHTPALKPDLGVFSTDFGVTFGHFICFDLMFQIPAIQVAQKPNIKDIIFSTMWFSEIPYLTAIQIQEAYAYAMDVNFLASGANNVKVGSAGSGIYSGKAGALVSILPGSPTTRLLVAKVPKVPGNVRVSDDYPGFIYDNPAVPDNLKLLRDSSITAHITEPLVQGFQEFTIADKDVSCRFRVKISNKENTAIQYRAHVQDGSHTYARREIGITACLLVACRNDDPQSCPYRFSQNEEAIIEELEIEMTTYRKQHNSSLNCDDIEYFPVSFRYNKFPLSPKNFTYTSKLNNKIEFPTCESDQKCTETSNQNNLLNSNDKETIIYKLNGAQNELVSFGIWGRVYSRDIDHNKGVSQEDIENFTSIMDHIYEASSEEQQTDSEL